MLSWNPVAKGDTYCSPACGGRCTRTAFQHATGAANALAARLGPGWTPRVWENLGWHWSVGHGELNVNPLSTGFIAYLGERPPGGRWTADGATPIEAIRAVLEVARAELLTVTHLVNVADAALKGAMRRGART